MKGHYFGTDELYQQYQLYWQIFCTLFVDTISFALKTKQLSANLLSVPRYSEFLPTVNAIIAAP